VGGDDCALAVRSVNTGTNFECWGSYYFLSIRNDPVLRHGGCEEWMDLEGKKKKKKEKVSK